MIRGGDLGVCSGIEPCRRSLFFFSSRRRHTRSLRDWSSDVCSSDLHTAHFSIGSGTRLAMEDVIALVKALEDEPASVPRALARYEATRRPILEKLVRSEERRVGKECRSRGSPDREENNVIRPGRLPT